MSEGNNPDLPDIDCVSDLLNINTIDWTSRCRHVLKLEFVGIEGLISIIRIFLQNRNTELGSVTETHLKK